jgi:hypothetical protein
VNWRCRNPSTQETADTRASLADFITWSQFFVHFFQLKITFRGKFRGISWKNDFSKLFPRKIPFFPTFFGGKFSAEFSLKGSPEKSRKNRPNQMHI